jgi:hypothetical protein
VDDLKTRAFDHNRLPQAAKIFFACNNLNLAANTPLQARRTSRHAFYHFVHGGEACPPE